MADGSLVCIRYSRHGGAEYSADSRVVDIIEKKQSRKNLSKSLGLAFIVVVVPRTIIVKVFRYEHTPPLLHIRSPVSF